MSARIDREPSRREGRPPTEELRCFSGVDARYRSFHEMGKGKVGIVGSGLIGRSWAMLFAGAGYTVDLFDVDDKKVDAALVDIEAQLKSLESRGLLRGSLSPQQQRQLIRKCATLAECIKGSVHVQASILFTACSRF